MKYLQHQGHEDLESTHQFFHPPKVQDHTFEKEDLKENFKRELLIIISEYLYRNTFVLDKEINAFTCCLELVKKYQNKT